MKTASPGQVVSVAVPLTAKPAGWKSVGGVDPCPLAKGGNVGRGTAKARHETGVWGQGSGPSQNVLCEYLVI